MRRAICFTAALMLAGALFAQQSLMSQHFEASGDRYWKQKYLFTSEADWFMDPNDHGRVDMQSFFAVAQATGFSSANQAAGGFATNLESIYLGVFFDLNLGSGGNFGFTNENEIQVIIGTSSIGAFKPFYTNDGNGDKFGLDWGMNISINGMTLKPEFMIAYYNKDKPYSGYKGYLNLGASLDVDFSPTEQHTASIQANYELRMAAPAANNGSYHDHRAAFLYQRLYSMTSQLGVGWGLGAKTVFNTHNWGNTKTGSLELYPEVVLGLNYSFNSVFGISGLLFFDYPINYTGSGSGSTAIRIGGTRVRPVLGAAFRPYPIFAIELRCDPISEGGLDNGIQPVRFSFMATIKK